MTRDLDDIDDDGFLVFRNPFLNPKDDDGMALLYRSFRSNDSVRYVVAAAVAASTAAAAAASIDRCFVPMIRLDTSSLLLLLLLAGNGCADEASLENK